MLSLSSFLLPSSKLVERDASALADPIESFEEPRRPVAQPGELVAAFGLFFDQDPAGMPRAACEAVGPDLADAFVNVVADLEAGGEVSCM